MNRYEFEPGKHPETEEQYFEAIEALGAFISSTQNACGRGRLEWEDVKDDLKKQRELQARLAQELSEKFDIVLVSNVYPKQIQMSGVAPPEGKRWYWVWYPEQRLAWLRREYDKLICSACPLSTHDMELFVREIPCTAFKGGLRDLIVASECYLVMTEWTPEKLRERILEEGGSEALEVFNAKQAFLRASA